MYFNIPGLGAPPRFVVFPLRSYVTGGRYLYCSAHSAEAKRQQRAETVEGCGQQVCPCVAKLWCAVSYGGGAPPMRVG